MPYEPPHRGSRLLSLVVAALASLIIGASACGTATERDNNRFLSDKRAVTEVARIDKLLSTGLPLLPDDFASLKAIAERYPRATRIKEVYRAALIRREDWAALEQFLSDIPEDERSREDKLDIARTYYRLGTFDRTIEIAEPLYEKDNSDLELNSVLVAAYFNLGRFDEAEAILELNWEAIVSGKRSEEITYRGLIQFRRNEHDKANETLMKAIEIAPQNSTALNALGRLHHLRGDAAKAEEFRIRNERIQAKRTADEGLARRRVQLIYELQEKWNANEFQDVILLARKAIDISDDVSKPVLYQYIAESYSRLGRPEEAKAALAEMQQINK